MRKVTRTAPAKINRLDVTELVRTVITFGNGFGSSIADTVTVELTDTPDIALTCDVAGAAVRKILPGKRQRYLMLPG
ncbi:MAG: hypothetical protein ACLR5S_05925 [Ruminococcus sp.]